MICPKCEKRRKPYRKVGRTCKRCYNDRIVARRRERRAEDPAWHRREKAADRAKKRALYKDPRQRKIILARVRRTQATRGRRYILKHWYGLTPEEWDHILAAQGGRCAICRRRNPGGVGWNTDHCHRMGKVRGILCCACNRGIGVLGDSPKRLRAAAEYIEQYEKLHARSAVTKPQ